MKLTHLRDITAVAERGSLRAAARQLGIAQPAITRSIREVEHELGVALFERRAKGVVLTPMGQLFLRRAITIQSELRLAREEIDQTRGLTTGQVCIAMSSAAQISLFPQTIAPFRKRFPGVFLRIRDGLFPAIEETLKEGNTDFYVGPLPEMAPTKEFVVERLFDNTRLVFGRKGHPLGKSTSLRELANARWISTAVTVDSTAELGPIFAQHGLPPPEVDMLAPAALALILTVGNSDLLMMAPEQWIDFPASRELLEPIMIAERLPAAPICIVHRARLPLTPAAEFLGDLFRRASTNYVRLRAERDGKKKRAG